MAALLASNWTGQLPAQHLVAVSGRTGRHINAGPFAHSTATAKLRRPLPNQFAQHHNITNPLDAPMNVRHDIWHHRTISILGAVAWVITSIGILIVALEFGVHYHESKALEAGITAPLGKGDHHITAITHQTSWRLTFAGVIGIIGWCIAATGVKVHCWLTPCPDRRCPCDCEQCQDQHWGSNPRRRANHQQLLAETSRRYCTNCGSRIPHP